MTTPFPFFSRASLTLRAIEARSGSLLRRFVGELSHLPMNPMAVASAALLFGASIFPWIGVAAFAVFGRVALPIFGLQASLWDLAGPRAPIPVGQGVALASLSTGLLLVVGGIATLWRGPIGTVPAGVGVALFFAASWGIFGVHGTASNFTVTIPGPGVEWAGAGLVAGVLAVRFQARPAGEIARGFRTSAGLARIGLFLAVCFLVVDVVDHGAGGNPLAVLGTGFLEGSLHATFVASVGLLAGLFLLRPGAFAGPGGTALVGLALAFLVLDGVYHTARGEIASFIGHTLPEMVAHTATYYGVAFLTGARLVATR